MTSSGAAQASTAGNTSGSVHCTLDVELMVGHRVFGNFVCTFSVTFQFNYVATMWCSIPGSKQLP